MVKFIDNLALYILGVENRKQGLKYISQIEMNLAICLKTKVHWRNLQGIASVEIQLVGGNG